MGFFTILGVAELIRVRLNKPANSTRNFIHISVGIVVSLCPFLFKVNIQLILLCVVFIAVNTFLYKIDAAKSMNAVERKSLGTIYFPVSVLILSLFFWDKPISFFIAVSVLTFADPIASIVGSKSRNHFYPWKDKNLLMAQSLCFPQASFW